MELTVRTITQKDLEIISEWWYKWHDGQVLSLDMLPNTGFIVENDGKPFGAVFMYITNSNIAAIQWAVSDNSYREEDREKGLQLLIKACELKWKKEGGKYLFFWGNNNKFNKSLNKLDFYTGDTGYDQLIKII